jgi:hypothetical protein
LAGAKGGRLRKALVEDAKLAAEIAGVVEANPRAAVAAIDFVPAGDEPIASLEERLDGEIRALGEQGPTPSEVALAKALIAGRIEKMRKTAQPAANGKARGNAAGGLLLPSSMPVIARTILDPAAYDRLLAQLNEVAVNSVKLAAKRLLAKDHRVVVTAGPAKVAALPDGALNTRD